MLTRGKFLAFFFGRDLLNNTLPQSVPHLILVDGRVPLLCAQVGRDKVVHFLSQVLIGGLPTTGVTAMSAWLKYKCMHGALYSSAEDIKQPRIFLTMQQCVGCYLPG